MRRSSVKPVFLFILFVVSVSRAAQYSGYSGNGESVNVGVDTSIVRFTFYRPDILRIDLLPSIHSSPDSSFVVIRDTALTPHIVDGTSALEISSSRITAQCRKRPFGISFRDAAGRILVEQHTMQSESGVGRAIGFNMRESDHFYGSGERGGSFDLRGLEFDSYNTQRGNYPSAVPTMNINIPFITTPNGYALYFDNISRGHFDFSDSSRWSYAVQDGILTMYLIAAPTLAEQLKAYCWLTGREPLPPRWAFGFLLSKNRYISEAETRGIVDTLRMKQFPCDGIVLDLGWFTQMGDLAWNTEAWPHPQQMMSDFLSRGIKTITITEPYLVETSANYRSAADSGFLATDSIGQPYHLDKWWSCDRQCSALLVDLTNPATQRWWWSKHPLFMGAGVAGLWTDLGEPERHPADMYHYLGKAERIHNIYNFLWAKTIFEGMNAFRPGERIFNLTRSGFAGIQRYGVITWSGDVARSFDGLAVQLPLLLNMGMSGLAYHNSDIGGYARKGATPELYARWMQFGTFCPMTRAHGAGEAVNGAPTEPWRFGARTEKICREYIRLRYRLLPYIYTMAHENYETGMPLARPLTLTFPNDATVTNRYDSYMWGDAFLVSPVTAAGELEHRVYLPEGDWVDFWSDRTFRGGRTITVAVPLERMPLFVRSGSLIPMGPPLDYSDERPLDQVTILVYPSRNRRTSYTMYEDDGHSLAYQSGGFATTTFTQTSSDSILTLTIGPSVGHFEGKLLHRTYVAEVRDVATEPGRVTVNGRSLKEYSNRQELGMKEGFWIERQRLSIQMVCNTDSMYSINVHPR